MVVAALTAAVTIVGMKPVFAISPAPCDLCGASDFAPGQEFKDDLKADSAKSFAPGQEAEQHCIGCVKELAPGQEGLEAGIIGPDLKK